MTMIDLRFCRRFQCWEIEARYSSALRAGSDEMTMKNDCWDEITNESLGRHDRTNECWTFAADEDVMMKKIIAIFRSTTVPKD